MKIQIISLQRTGSKSLEKAIQDKLPNRLKFSNGDELGEVLHLWGEHNYKFGVSAAHPFDRSTDILFHTNPAFKEYNGSNFTPLVTEKSIKWEPIGYQEELDYKKSVSIKESLIEQATLLNQDLLIKTQLAFIGYNLEQMVNVVNGWDYLVFLTPRNLVRWICSNYLCDVTGVFAPVAEQEAAKQAIEESSVTIPREYMNDKLQLLHRHLFLQNSIKRFLSVGRRTRVIQLYTEQLNSDVTAYTLRELGLGRLEIPVEKEFNTLDYSKVIANYELLEGVVSGSIVQAHKTGLLK